MENTLYWVWLQTALDPRSNIRGMLNLYKTPKTIFDATPKQREQSGIFTKVQLRQLHETDLKKATSILESCEKGSYPIITPDSFYYPKRLKTIRNYPTALYVDGDLTTLRAEVLIGIVGTRNASRYALEATRRLACDLTVAGAVVVSGGALGVDSAAHVGSFLGQGKTIAFLGNGFGDNYLRANKNLRTAISQNGALVTEYPPGTPASRTTFPTRNRLISGASLGTIVLEAGLRSGSLITAKYAGEQNRDVFAVPGSVLSSNNAGTNKLLADGAKPVFGASDVLEEYAKMYPNEINLSIVSEPLYASRRVLGVPSLKKDDKSYTIIGSSENTLQITLEQLREKNTKNNEKEEAARETEIQKAIPKKDNSQERKALLLELPDVLRDLFVALPDEFDINLLVNSTDYAYSELAGMLAELEIYGAIVSTAGGRYRIDNNYR